MFLDFLIIWMISLISISATSFLAVAFVLVVTGVVEQLDPHEKGELQGFATIVLGSWSVGLSLILSQIVFILR